MNAGYTGTPLAGKLGIKPATSVLLDGASTDLALCPMMSRCIARPARLRTP
jgi:hypothetical protein